AAVVAQPDPKWGETPCAFVETKPGAAIGEAELIAHCQQYLARFKAPKKIVFGELPKTSTGKIQKFVLREKAKSTSAIESNSNEPFVGDLFRRCCNVMLSIQRLPQPVIARVHGIATAAGCQLVAASDLAVAADDARFATSGINFGLFCATPGVPVSRNVSQKRAFEMLMTGHFIDAPTALAWGLV